MIRNKKYKNRVILFVSIIVELLILLLVVYFSSSGTVIQIGKGFIPAGNVSGILMAITIMITVLITVWCDKIGYITAKIMLFVNLVGLSQTIIVRKNFSVLPGLATVTCTFFMLYLLRRYLLKLQRKEKELNKLAYSDALTGLPNRRKLSDYMKELIDHGNSSKKKKEFALIFLDIDDFKAINDNLNHDIGDEVLCELVRRWKEYMGDIFLARLGGDEFAGVVTNYESRDLLKRKVEDFLKYLGRRYRVGGHDIYLSASIGIAFYPKDDEDIASLWRYADLAMYSAKRRGKGKVCSFNSKLDMTIKKESEIEQLIHHNLESDGFQLVFQPLFYTDSRVVKGFETLLRMKDENGNFVSPSQFIPIAENKGLIREVTKWVLNESMNNFLPIALDHDITLNINISAIHLQNPNFVSDVKEAIASTGFPPELLEIEITESACICAMDYVMDILRELKEMGIKIALDDFGTGYASLSYLMKLPIDVVKIDKEFIDAMFEENKGMKFIETVISLCHLWDFKVVAEGVESAEQFKALKELGCDYLQGYIWGKPTDLDTAMDVIRNNERE